MASNLSKQEELLKRPLYVYDLPRDLLDTLTSKASTGDLKTPIVPSRSESPAALTTPPQSSDSERESAVTSATSCGLCQVSFANVQEQREHTRTDHHRYNLKSRLRGGNALNETEFNKAIGELDESISGSESEDTAEEGEEDGLKAPDTTLTALLKRQAKIFGAEEEVVPKKKRGAGKHPVYWFESPLLAPSTSLGVYRALFTNVEQEEPDHFVESLRNKQVASVRQATNKAAAAAIDDSKQTAKQPSPHVFLCMIGGGHFAAMIVVLAPEIIKKAGGIEERQARVLAHKTFHRYTTRRKQGGAQSANDAAKGAAHSAGSSLRRYNEAALENEIRQLLEDWKGMIDESELIFVRATGNTNRRILFGPYDGQVLKQNDARLRGFPFSTRRATQGELMRAFTELTRVKVSHIDEAALAREEAEREREAAAAAAKAAKPAVQSTKPKLSKEEEAAIMHTTQIHALIRRSKVPALLAYISNNSLPPTFTFHPSANQQQFRCPTPLHLAASSNSPAVIVALLTKVRVDPTCLNEEGMSAFDVGTDRATRDAFRISRHELGESAWDWEAAHIPSAISKAEVDSRAEREKKAADEAEAERRKTEIERIRREDALKKAQEEQRNNKRIGPGRTLASVEKTPEERREEEARGMTPEMRTRFERERRARAAEERMRRMQAGAGR
ncbi:hypothetical protein AJ80_08000 [Polytolypa hystricis UAMH7299]|uniref:VLRF1 domain-containing protein n=1 Tax=Polytolypa hystricis (strain UAMH7299) TaxID=1447883 RepID=A0A2B7XEQ2_POLH7|nr:hypothetical protein AJ80_08000 [Polytolypa hystricis UAMH7299]